MFDGKIACLLGPGFEDREFHEPFAELRRHGYRVEIVGERAGERLKGKRGDEEATVDRSIDDVRVDDYGLLFIPGGHSPDALRTNPRIVDFVRAFDRAGKPIAAICHGPQLFISAGIQRGRKLTAWPTVQVDLKEAGAQVLDGEVVEDGNWLTSRKPADLEAFSDALLRRLASMAPRDAAEAMQPQA